MNLKDETWLAERLVKALSWDTFLVEGVVDAISKAQHRAEVAEIVESFMNNDASAMRLIDEYLLANGKASIASAAAAATAASGSSGRQTYAASARPAVAAAAPPPDLGDGLRHYDRAEAEDLEYMATSKPKGNPKPKREQLAEQTRQAVESEDVHVIGGSSSSSSSHPAADRADGKVLGMFKRGGKIKAPKRSGGREDATAAAAAERLERPVVNCLACGKIFDCRNPTPDVQRFLDRNGACTFCNARVALTYNERSQENERGVVNGAATGSGGGDGGEPFAPGEATEAGGSSTAAPSDAATAEARAFKDRLVDYDRNAAKRTTVIDDQSDYFEIDANKWLTDEEREDLRARAQLEQEAEEERRKQFTVTFDLIGRQVLVDNGRKDVDAAQPATAAAASASHEAGDVDAAREAVAAGGSSRTRTAEETAAEVAKVAAALRDMRICVNPSIRTPPPVFVPRAAAAAKATADRSMPKRAAAAAPAPAAGSSKAADEKAQHGTSQHPQASTSHAAGSQASSSGRGAAPSTRRPGPVGGRHVSSGRVQDEDVFQAFETVVLYDDYVAAEQAAAQHHAVKDLWLTH